jgi:outer membrane protein OmpA-like peptidoglycan-associated protein
MLLAATALVLPVVARAQPAINVPVTGLYVAGGVGANFLHQKSVSNTFGGSSTQLNALPGEIGVLSLGWGFGNGFRAEVEGNWSMNRFDGLANAGVSSSAGGTEQKYGLMVNGYYDFNNVSPLFVPFVGVGVGYEAAQWRNVNAYTLGASPAESITTNTSTLGGFAYQAILGASVPVSMVPGLSVTAEYRFMGVVGDRNYGGTATVAGVGSSPVELKAGPDYNSAILVGVRYAFGAPPPPPAPAPAPVAAPAPAPARSYLVFFDWDQATLTTRAQQIIKEAADNSTKVQYTRIDVNGYTDTSGTPQYNQGLSMRRAQAVAGELVRDGVPRNAIGIQGFGETHLLVPTGAGVREPQNRRVEIVIH